MTDMIDRQYQVNDYHWRQQAQKIVENLELGHVVPADILFIEDTTTEDKPDKPASERRYFNLSAVPPALVDIVGASYYCIVYRLNLNFPTRSYIAAALADELLKVPEDGASLVKPEIRTHKRLARVLGDAEWRLKRFEELKVDVSEPLPGSVVQEQLDLEAAADAETVATSEGEPERTLHLVK